VLECPENTLAAFEWADRIGADLVELDLRATADGNIVIIHDRTVNRTTNGVGATQSLTLKQIRSLDAGSGQMIPTLDESLAFAKARQLSLLLDIKDPIRVAPEALYAALIRHTISNDVVIGIRTLETLRAFKRLDPNLRTLAFASDPGSIDDYIDEGADIVRLWVHWARANPQLVDEIHARGRGVWVTTGMLRGKALHNLVDSGVEGLITNYPDDVLTIRRPVHFTRSTD